MKTNIFKFVLGAIVLIFSFSSCYERREHRERVEESREHHNPDGDRH